MQIEEAAKILSAMYHQALPKEKALSIHLFGIKYSDEIRDMPSKEIAERAGIKVSYGAEIRKGINLAKYVKVRG